MISKIKVFTWNVFQTFFFICFTPFFIFVFFPYTRFRRYFKKLAGKKPSIIWGPVPIINISYNRLADRSRSYKSDCLVYNTYHITQSSLFDYNLQKYKENKSRIYTLLFQFFAPFAVLVWASVKYDIFHFFFNGGFLYVNNWLIRPEIIILKLIGKIIIFSAYGADVRLESVTRHLGKYHAYMDMTHDEVVKEVNQSEKQIHDRVHFMLRWADTCLSMGDMIEYTPGSNNEIFYWAIDTHEWHPIFEPKNSKIIILHAPNHTHYKGTRFLLPIITRLKKEGFPIEFVLIQKMSNEQARKYYEKADIIAEQFIIGWHGFFAVESMALGKPVLCYIRKKEYLPANADCPIVNTTPDNLYDNLKSLITNKTLRVALGKQGRKYVEQVFSLEAVGKRLDLVYKKIW